MKESALKLIKIAAFNVFKVFIWPNFAWTRRFTFYGVVRTLGARGAFVEVFIAGAAAATYLAGFLVRLTKAF